MNYIGYHAPDMAVFAILLTGIVLGTVFGQTFIALWVALNDAINNFLAWLLMRDMRKRRMH